jgi:hypothetical protein
MKQSHMFYLRNVSKKPWKKQLTFLISLLFLTLLFSLIPSASADDQSLAEQYAPQLYFEAQETCFPVTAEYAIENSELYQYPDQLIEENPTSESLAAYAGTSYSDYYLDNELGSPNSDAIINDYQNKMQSLGYTVYYQVYTNGGVTIIQYWFYYAFNNGELNQHEGDWEMVQVYLNGGTPTQVMFSQHESGQKATWGQVEKNNGHIKVYVARGSHANYLRYYSGKIGIANDNVGANGHVLKPSQYQLDSLSDKAWIDFGGRWGEMDSIEDTLMGRSGPYGPMFRQDGVMWSSPDSWGASLPAADNNILLLELILYHFLTIFIIVTAITLLFIFFKLWKQYKRTGLGPRILSFLYIDGVNLKSIGNLLFIAGIVIAIIAVFSPWYAISADISTTEFSTEGSLDFFVIDGMNGVQISYPGSNGPVPMGTLVLPFGAFILIGIVLTLIKTMGISESSVLGKKYLWRGIRFLIPMIILIIGVAIIGSVFSGLVPSEVQGSSVSQIFSSLSSSPFGGSQMITLAESGVTGTVEMHWGFASGGLLFILAGLLLIIGGFLEKKAGETFFAGGTKQEG